MTGWQFQYWNGSAWMNFANAQIDHILEELSSVGGQEECVFDLPNTSANRAIVQALPYVQCLFGGSLIFPLANQLAVVGGLKYSTTTVEVTAYNAVFAKMSQASQTITAAYTGVAANTILAAICTAAGVTAGACPTFAVSIKFNNANCFKAAQDLAAACGLDYWADGNGFNIGTRDSTVQTLGYVGSNSKRGLDYTKTVDTVIVRGVDNTGAAIQGVAYSSGFSASNTGSLATFTEKKAADVATLNNVASFKLQKLNNPSNGNSLECLISQVAAWHPGQYVSASRADLALVGSYIIQRITKQAVSCTVEVDAAMPQMDVDALQQDDDTSALASLTQQPQTQIPVNVPLGSLLDLYHLTDGSGTSAKDSTPNGNAINGTITNGSWVTSSAFPGEYFLQLASNGYVDLPAAGNSISGTQAFAVGGWFSPSALTNLANLIGKANAFILELYGIQGAVQFGVCVGGTWTYVQSPNGVATANGRVFAMGVYDGKNIYLYVSDPSGINQLLINLATGYSYFSAACTGNVNASTSDTYIGGSNYAGVVSECMIWGRALQPAEVQALFFRPLNEVVAKGGISGWDLVVDVNNPAWGNTNPAPGVQAVGAGQSLQVTAIPAPMCQFQFWQMDGVNYPSWSNPVTISAQTTGSVHDLIAIFTGYGFAAGRTIQQTILSVLFNNSWAKTIQQTIASVLFTNSWAKTIQQTINEGKVETGLLFDLLAAIGNWGATGNGGALSVVSSTPTPLTGQSDCIKDSFSFTNQTSYYVGIIQTFGTSQNWTGITAVGVWVYLPSLSYCTGVSLILTDKNGKQANGGLMPASSGWVCVWTPYSAFGVASGFDITNVSSIQVNVLFSNGGPTFSMNTYVAFNYLLVTT
jgi:hypothetical protein